MSLIPDEQKGPIESSIGAEADRLRAERDRYERLVAQSNGERDRGAEWARRDRERAEAAEAEVERLREALRDVSNAYGCFVGCTAGLPGAFDDPAHTPACSAARAALSPREDA